MSRHRVRAAAVVICGGLLVAGLAIAPATGHKKKFRSTITISHPDVDRWEGEVRSPRRNCERNRLVTLYESGLKPYDYPLGEDRTDAQGRWEITVPIGANYYAKVKRVRRGGPNHRHICKGDRSPTIK